MSLKYLIPLLFSCTQVVEVAGPENISNAAEQYCKDHPELPCGHVYACNTPADNAIGLVEVCIPQFMDVSAAEAVYGECMLSPSPRFHDSHLCWWCCGEGCGAGCNSYNGCLCLPN